MIGEKGVQFAQPDNIGIRDTEFLNRGDVGGCHVSCFGGDLYARLSAGDAGEMFTRADMALDMDRVEV